MSEELDDVRYTRVIRWIDINVTGLDQVTTVDDAEQVILQRIGELQDGSGLRAAIQAEQVRRRLQEIVSANVFRIEQQRIEEEQAQEEESGRITQANQEQQSSSSGAGF